MKFKRTPKLLAALWLGAGFGSGTALAEDLFTNLRAGKPDVVRIEQGELQGYQSSGASSFLGIPYAAPIAKHAPVYAYEFIDTRRRPPSSPSRSRTASVTRWKSSTCSHAFTVRAARRTTCPAPKPAVGGDDLLLEPLRGQGRPQWRVGAALGPLRQQGRSSAAVVPAGMRTAADTGVDHKCSIWDSL